MQSIDVTIKYMQPEDFITVYHTSPLEKPPHLFPVTQSVDSFLGGKKATANMHVGTIEAALHRKMNMTDQISYDNFLPRPSTEASQTYIHAYRMPKSLIDTSQEYLDNANLLDSERAGRLTVQEFDNDPNLKKILPYTNVKEDIGSTSYLIPKSSIGSEVEFLGSSPLGDEPFELAEQRVLKAAGIDNFYDWDGTLMAGDKKLTGSEALNELRQRAIADLRSQDLGASIQLTKRESYWPGLYPPAATEEIGSTKPIQGVISSNPIESIEEGLEKIIARTNASKNLLSAAREASAAVAGGINQSGTLRAAAAAATILKKKIN